MTIQLHEDTVLLLYVQLVFLSLPLWSTIENNICTLIQLMITLLLDDPIMCDLPIKVIKIDEFLSMMGLH